MRLLAGGCVVALVCAGVCASAAAADQASGTAGAKRDYNAERAALVATVIAPSRGGEQGWESLESAIRAVAMSQQRITESLRLRYGLAPDTPIDIDPLLLIDAPEEEEPAAPAAEHDDVEQDGDAGDAPKAGGDEAADEGAHGASEPTDMKELALQGARTLMRTYEGNHIYDRMTTLRVQPQAYIPLDDKPLMMRDFSYAGGARTLARLEAARMWKFLEGGDEKKAADCFESILAMGVVFSREPSFVGRLMAIASFGTATQTLERWMLENRLDGEFAKDLLGRLERQSSRLTPMSYTLEGERLTGLDTIQRVFTREIPAPMVMADGEAGSLKAQDQCEQALNDLYDAMAKWAAAPAHERKDIDPSPATLVEKMPAGLVLVKLLAPGLEEGVWLAELGRVDRQGMELMLALEAGRTPEGKFVESLDALVPGVMKELPRDGYSPDGRYVYHRSEEGVQRTATGYLLYSVGYDGQDNGGKIPVGAPEAVALRPGDAGKGTDYVINRRTDE